MSENLNNHLTTQKNPQTQNKTNQEYSPDIEKYNTYSDNNLNQDDKQNLGFNEILDINKFNSKVSAYENQTNDRKNLVDKLFDESISNDIAKQEENILDTHNNENQIYKNDLAKINNNNNPNENKVHLFTESAHELSVRDSDLFALDKKLNLNSDVDKNSKSAFNFGYNPNASAFGNNVKMDDLPANKSGQINGNSGNENDNNNNIVPAYNNSALKLNQENDENNERYIYKDKVVDKSYLISRLFSDNINTETENNVYLNDSALAYKRKSFNENKIEPPKILSNTNIINNVDENNFSTNHNKNFKNPFDDTEDQIQVNMHNESFQEKPNSKKLDDITNLNSNSNKINSSVNQNVYNVTNLDERISFNNPNFIISNLDSGNANIQKDANEEDLIRQYSGSNILAKLSDKPFKSINIEVNELEQNLSGEKNKQKINLNTFDSFDNNNRYNDHDNVNNIKNMSIPNNKLENLKPAIINNVSNNEYLARNASIPFTKNLVEKVIDKPTEVKQNESIKESSFINNNANEKMNDIAKTKEEADRASKYMMSSQNQFMASDKITNFDKSKKNFKEESDFNLLGGADDSKGEISNKLFL